MKQRQSNMELLRIVSISMIVLFHCAYKSGFEFASDMSVNKLIAKTLWMLGELGVNLFMLLSGFYMVNGRFKWQKLVLIIVEVQFYYWVNVLVAVWLGIGDFPTGKELFLALFPVAMNRWWFITAYVMIYVLSPYLNIFAKSMGGGGHPANSFRHSLCCSRSSRHASVFFNTTETMLYYNRFIWLIVVYLIGGYMSRVQQISVKTAAWTTVAAAAVLVVSIAAINQFAAFFEILGTTEQAYFWPPNTVPMVALSIGVFGLFVHLEIPHNRIINVVASTTLGIYLLSDGVLAPWLWREFFRSAEYQESPTLFWRMLCATAIVLAVIVVIDLARQQIMRPLSKALERHTKYPYLKEAGDRDAKFQ